MGEQAARALMRAARLSAIFATLGHLLVALGALSMVPATVSLLLAGPAAVRLLVVSAIQLIGGLALVRLRRRTDVQWNEALAVTGMAFMIAPLAMVWPLMGAGIGWLDAWFEAVSGITTTGLTTVTHLAERPQDFLFLRAWIQWYGGLGIAVLSVALLMHHEAAGRRLLQTTGDSLTHTGSREHAQRVFIVYIVLTLATVAATYASGVDTFSALLHGLAAVATGGFAPSDQNIAPLPGATVAVLSIACLAAAIRFPLYADRRKGAVKRFFTEPEVRALFAATSITALLLVFFSADLISLDRIANALVLSISAQTDTGFSATDIAALPDASKLVLMVSMTIGGCTGSTAGGIKLIRLLVVLQLIRLALARTAVAEHSVLAARIDHRRIEPDIITGVLQLLSLWLLVLLLSWLVFLAHR